MTAEQWEALSRVLTWCISAVAILSVSADNIVKFISHRSMEQKTLAESSSSVATAADVITDAAAKTIKLTLDQHERELSDMREILNSRFCVTMEFEIYPKSKMISQTITMLPKLNGRTLPMPPAHERKRASM